MFIKFPNLYPNYDIYKINKSNAIESLDSIKEILNNDFTYSRTIHTTLECPLFNDFNDFKLVKDLNINKNKRAVIMKVYEYRKNKNYKYIIVLYVINDNNLLNYLNINNACFISDIYNGNPLIKIRNNEFIEYIKSNLINYEHLFNNADEFIY